MKRHLSGPLAGRDVIVVIGNRNTGARHTAAPQRRRRPMMTREETDTTATRRVPSPEAAANPSASDRRSSPAASHASEREIRRRLRGAVTIGRMLKREDGTKST